MKKIILPFLALIMLCSCGHKVILEESRSFNNSTWLRFEPEHFVVHADNTEDCYNFYVTLHVDTTLFRETGLPIMLETKSPEGETRTLFSTVLLRNHEGSWLGEFGNDGTLEVTQMVRQFYFFNVKGDHTIDLSQRTSKYEIRGIRDLNFKIEKTKIEYPE